MMKALLAGTVVFAVVGAGFALAQSGTQQSAAPQQAVPGWRPSADDIAAFADARIAALKAGLKLTAEQEKNWPAVEAAIRDLAKQRADRMQAWADRREARREARAAGTAPPQSDTIERLRRGADAMATRAAGIKRLADAAEPLYRSLDDDQRRRFAMLLRMGRHSMRFWHRRAG
jgi:hypothetical protein